MESNVSLLQLCLGVIALSLALGVVVARGAVASAVCLMGTLFVTAFLYIAQGAYFAGIVQILIYAGAIAVLFVFIIMLLDVKESKVLIPGQKLTRALSVFAALFFVLLFSFLIMPAMSEFGIRTTYVENFSAMAIAQNFVSTYMLPFQMTGLLVLGAILGVVMLAKSVRGDRKNKEVKNV